jgi:zinc/manganese transport system permease protein
MVDPCDEPIFQTRITPHRSLDARGFRLLFALFAALCVASSIPFVVLGAWPVAGFLGLGVLLIPLLHIRVDLEAVLFGDLLAAGASDLVRTLVAFAAVLLLLGLRYRQLVYLGVDPLGAAAAGLPVRRLRLLLTLVTAFTVVSAMSAVGVVLVIALMGAPALLALTGAVSLRQALVRASVLGLLISGAGFGLAIQPAINLPPGPLIGVLCMGLLPLAALRRR